ncbi:MAG: hypothetical protein ACOX0C_02950 [Patescibacteria group bacterium]|jgi:hypothetical protein
MQVFFTENYGWLMPTWLIVIVLLGTGIVFVSRLARAATTKVAILEAIRDKDLIKFLVSIRRTPAGVFEGAREIRMISGHLTELMSMENLSEVLACYDNLSGAGKADVRAIFKRAFISQGVAFWTNAYFLAVVKKRSKDLVIVRKVIKEVYPQDNRARELLMMIYKELHRYYYDLLFKEDGELRFSLEQELRDFQAALKIGYYPW